MMRSSSSAANFDGIISNNNNKLQVDDDEVLLPGFRFHPTDEELVGFYLRRKVEKKAFSIELIKQIDIYKYDPWDLPKVISTVGDKELYFFCIRERKYRNSVRPNRVTGSGFWKATGIDKPIYSVGGGDHNINTNKVHCIIGLKKSLVYYRGSAGKGTKTDWMMHEFRLPPPLIATTAGKSTNNHNHHQNSSAKIINSTTYDQEAAEIWTLCRIFKRNVVSYKNKYPQADAAADCKEELMTSSSSIKQNSSPSTYSSSSSPPPRRHQQSFSLDQSEINRDHQKYNNNKYYCSGLLASDMVHHHQQIIKGKTRQLPVVVNHIINERSNINSTLSPAGQLMNCITHHHEPSTTSTSLQPNYNFQNLNANSDFFSGRDGNWDELGSVVEFMSDQSLLYGYR